MQTEYFKGRIDFSRMTTAGWSGLLQLLRPSSVIQSPLRVRVESRYYEVAKAAEFSSVTEAAMTIVEHGRAVSVVTYLPDGRSQVSASRSARGSASFALLLALQPWDSRRAPVENPDEWLRLLRAVAAADGEVTFGRAGRMEADESRSEESDALNAAGLRPAASAIRRLGWWNVIGPAWVRFYGREHVLSTPAYRVEELENGAITLQLWATPEGYASPEGRDTLVNARSHLNPALDRTTIRNEAEALADRIEPVAPTWDSDVAPLVRLLVDEGLSGSSARFSDRYPLTQSWNAYSFPEVTELGDICSLDSTRWRAASSEDRESMADYAERFEILAPERLELWKRNPSGLPALDYFLAVTDYGNLNMFPDRDAVVARRTLPALAAFMGELMVRELGGQWYSAPGERPVIVIGDVVAKPFDRAEAALCAHRQRPERVVRPGHPVIAHSQTQFYRRAERMVGRRSR